MRIRIVSDSHSEVRLDRVVHSISNESFFDEQEYGAGLVSIGVVLMCRDPALDFKCRVKLSKREKKLYLDIMLDLSTMKIADDIVRRRIVAERLLREVPATIAKYKISDFDLARFISDWKVWVGQLGWL